MRRKIVALNLALVALTALAAWRLRVQWLAAKARQQATMRQTVKPFPPPPYGALKPAPPVAAAGYADIAQKMLFSRDRNPTVVVEAPPAPPPKPMPPLPVLHGVMNLGDGPLAILSEKPASAHHDYRPGEQIGEFKLVAVNNREIVLEWEGKQVVKSLEELVDRSTPPPAAAAPDTRSAAAAPPKPTNLPSGIPAPGVDIGRGVKACQAGDSSSPGTVVDNYRKVVTESPFGQVCRWEPVK